jgi:hypothetical protein
MFGAWFEHHQDDNQSKPHSSPLPFPRAAASRAGEWLMRDMSSNMVYGSVHSIELVFATIK